VSGVARRWVVVLVGIVSMLAVCASASALWTGQGTGSVEAEADALGAPTEVTVTAVDHQSLTIAWSAPAGGPAPTGYVVRRSSGEVVCTTAASSCTDSGLAAATTYGYTVEATLHAWVGPTAAGSGATGSTTAPTVAIAFPSGGVDAGAWAGGCSPAGICGTATAGTADLVGVDVAVEGPSGWWDGTAFASAAEVWHPATGTTSWTFGFGLPPAGSYTVVARVTDLDGGTATDTETFTVGVANTPPQLVKMEMFDTASGPRPINGRIDTVVVTFDEPLAASTATAPWTLANVPSGGTLQSVSTSGSTATLTLTEGTGAEDTAVGTFTVALAADSSAGIRDSAGMAASFTARAPADKAGPVLVSLADQPAGSGVRGTAVGRAQAGDTLDVTFSEPIQAPSTSQVVRIEQESNSSNSTLVVPGVVTVTDMGGRYISDNGAKRLVTFTDSTLALRNSNRTVRVILGTVGGHTPGTVAGSATATLEASASVVDLAGAPNAASTAPRSFTNIRFF